MSVYTMVDGEWVHTSGVKPRVNWWPEPPESRRDDWRPAREATKRAAYFEARLALFRSTRDVRLFVRDYRSPDTGHRRDDVIVVIAEWREIVKTVSRSHTKRTGYEVWRAVWPVSVTHQHEPILLRGQAEALVRVIADTSQAGAEAHVVEWVGRVS